MPRAVHGARMKIGDATLATMGDWRDVRCAVGLLEATRGGPNGL